LKGKGRKKGEAIMDWRVRKVITHLECNIDKQQDLKDLSILVNLSPSRLGHLFKLHTGMSLTLYRKLLKLQKAKELMEKSCLSIKEIMVSVGISDKSHFTKDFKKIFGLSPIQYRNHHRNAEVHHRGVLRVAGSANK
jgi:transcriptional regulator GlxA family with amidase domain